MKKVDVARIQLERAMSLFTVEEDMVSAITLAGAAEELLGRQVAPNARDEIANFVARRLESRGETFDRKALLDTLCFARNSMKHLRVGDRTDMNFDLTEEASELIDRAVTNYVRLLGNWPDSDLYVAYCKKRSG